MWKYLRNQIYWLYCNTIVQERPDFLSNFHPGLRAAERHDPGSQHEGAPGPHDHPVGARGKQLTALSSM